MINGANLSDTANSAHVIDRIGSANEVQSLFADLFAALGIALNDAFGFAYCCGGVCGKSGRLGQVANLATCSVPAVPGLGVEFFVNCFAPGRLRRPICGGQFGPAQVLVNILAAEDTPATFANSATFRVPLIKVAAGVNARTRFEELR